MEEPIRNDIKKSQGEKKNSKRGRNNFEKGTKI